MELMEMEMANWAFNRASKTELYLSAYRSQNQQIECVWTESHVKLDEETQAGVWVLECM